jgi:hypothetical protein
MGKMLEEKSIDVHINIAPPDIQNIANMIMKNQLFDY